MSLALIEESAKEVRRLAIAGSPLALGDFRLKKLIPPLEQAGAKVPVFAQVAQAIGNLVNGPEEESATRLLNLSTLVNAILYTQGEAAAEGELREFETFPTTCASTRTTARVLKPIVQALTSSGGGRLEIIKSACERGAFHDLRLIDPAIQALGDNYPEVADLVAEQILPGYGPGIVPRLKATFDPKGKKHNARKLTLMHRLDPGGTVELCKTALDEGSPEVKAAAIGCLGKHEECLPLVQEHAHSKNKLIRGAALEALAPHERPDIAKLFMDLLRGKALDILAAPFRAVRSRLVLNALFDEGKRVFDLVLKGDSAQWVRYGEILDCLEHRDDTEGEEFLVECFSRADKLAKVKAAQNATVTGADLLTRVASLLYRVNSPKAFEAILTKKDILPAAAFPYVLYSAIGEWPAEKVFTEFSPFLDAKNGAVKEKGDAIERLICATHWERGSRLDPLAGTATVDDSIGLPKSIALDDRWLDAAIKAGRTAIVCCLARPNHRAAVDYLLKASESKKTDAGMTVRALARCEYPKVADYFLELVARKTKGAKYLDYELLYLLENARYLPSADLPRLDAFATKLDEKFVDDFLQAIAPLRTRGAMTGEQFNYANG